MARYGSYTPKGTYDAGDTLLVQVSAGDINRLTQSAMEAYIESIVTPLVGFEVASDGGVFAYSLKSGVSQVAAGAAAYELWVDTADQTIKLGV